MKNIAKGVAGALLAVGAVVAPLATQASAAPFDGSVASAPTASHRGGLDGDRHMDRGLGGLRHADRDDRRYDDDRWYDNGRRYDDDRWYDNGRRYDHDWRDRGRSCRWYDDRHRMTYRYRWDRFHHRGMCFPYWRH
ncbi:hypothetical protein [Streptomyces griseoluteus]|uniref:hypothetical protein n=1 Tax=Streptomyces griseoluteus TaxID=29306 RepID=UPI0036FEE125